MNIANLLKYCPKGTKLYSTIWGNVTLSNIFSMGNIAIKTSDEHVEELFDNGRYNSKGECILFPSKNQRNWKKFRVPANKGDIMMLPDGSTPFIFKGYWGDDKYYCNFYCGIDLTDNLVINHDSYSNWTGKFVIPASEEAKKKLFAKLKENGYEWNSKTLKLEKMKSTEVTFKEGDIIIGKNNDPALFTGIIEDNYLQTCCWFNTSTVVSYTPPALYPESISSLRVASKEEKNKFYAMLLKEGYIYDKELHELVKLRPFERVLVRDNIYSNWEINFYSHVSEDNYISPYSCLSGNVRYCIPYEGNEYLLGTDDTPENYQFYII